jgi:hypothetical protein
MLYKSTLLIMTQFSKKKVKGIPNYFKKVGLAIIIIAIALPVAFKIFNPEFLTHNVIMKTIVTDLIIMGLLIIALANDKVQDEMYSILRLQMVFFAFIWGVSFVIFYPFLDVFYGEPLSDVKGPQLIISMLLVYNLIYAFQKRRLNK